jgi:hypothetical protein
MLVEMKLDQNQMKNIITHVSVMNTLIELLNQIYMVYSLVLVIGKNSLLDIWILAQLLIQMTASSASQLTNV